MTTPVHVLPRIGEHDEHFWTSGRDGVLEILHCQSCGFWIHPGRPRCPECLSTDVEPEPVSGNGTVYTYTVNEKEWNPTLEHPYVIGHVELEEQENLRVTSKICECDPADVSIGMPVAVFFEQREDVWIPLFRPRGSA